MAIVLARHAAQIANRDATAALVVVAAGVQRHVQIANEMDHVARGIGAFLRVGVGVLQNGQLIGDGLGDAARISTKVGERRVRSVPRIST